MSEAHKVCPICEARNHRNAALCSTCGATIANVPNAEAPADEPSAPRYDDRYGEADLAEASARATGRLWGGLLLFVLCGLIAGLSVILLRPSASSQEAGAVRDIESATPTRIAGPSVTPGTPTATLTPSLMPSPTSTQVPTAAPCVQRVAAGDSLIAIVYRCGYSNVAVLPTVMALNDITDETRLQIGQEIVVPRPSPTPDPAATQPANADDDSASADAAADELLRLAFDPFAPTLTPTLLPGLMWHPVQPDENIISISIRYKSDAKALSDLNPEIDFPLCDFSQRFGGPECTVVLSLGQRIRVPAPTPTITPIPTASGSETPTPSPTATFNAPIAQSPADEAFFSSLEQVTLRWVGTGHLAPDETYRVVVTDAETAVSFTADTRELFLIVPAEWQAQDAGSRHYDWSVSVTHRPSGERRHTSAPRRFVWQGRG